MINIDRLIKVLQERRKVFHSEDDLKLSLGMVIQTIYSTSQVRLERPIDLKMLDWNGNRLIARAPIDVIIIEKNGNVIPVELKYKTKRTQLAHNDELYRLTEHGAVDIGRYSFRKDIYRIEQYLHSNKNSMTGYVLILSNDKAYFNNDVSNKDNYDKFFSFHDESVVGKVDKGWNYQKIDKSKYKQNSGDKKWRYINQNKFHWTCSKELFYKLNLKNKYMVKWNSYSSFENTEFRYCLIKIQKKKK